eukprot:gnl/TRDRNA2_/TRDRNA2_189800_c0_seq1.p1 gnl/TRDRNA2_/TRDRNA2_189800_c0~~gnl/TRDRNA2_/TRDRNA2_189800_c0_seq1.p1  ORF type:complete len:827 (-),score=234.66 gnl/TRDRNA2_/TRDRNA2_189800_c0_seq1:58-2457(-)
MGGGRSGDNTTNGAAVFLPPAVSQGSSSRVAAVQVCGRLEQVPLASFSLAELAAAVERQFEVRPPFLFADRDGRQLQGDAALSACAEQGDTIYVKLTEGVMHDFGRRVDQFRHLQWGYLSDQLTALKREHNGLQVELRRWRSGLEAEQGSREQGYRDLLQRGEDLQELIREERAGRETQLQALGEKTAELQRAERQSAEQHEAAVTALQRGLSDLAQALGDERKHREAADAAFVIETDNMRKRIQGEAVDREDLAMRLHKDAAEAQAAVEGAAAAWRVEALELRQQLADLRQALVLEQRERVGADGDAMQAVTEAQRMISQESMEKQAESASFLGKMKELEIALDTMRIDTKRVTADVALQAEQALDVVREKQVRQAQEASEMVQQIEELRRALEQEAQERELVSIRASKSVQELAKRDDDEMRVRDAEIAKLLRLVTEESDRRQDGDRKLAKQLGELEVGSNEDSGLRAQEHRDLLQSFSQCSGQLKAVRSDYAGQIDEINEKLAQQKRSFAEEQKRYADQTAELNMRIQELQRLVESEGTVRATDVGSAHEAVRESQRLVAKVQQGASAAAASIASDLKDLQARVEREAHVRETSDETLSRNNDILSRNLAELSGSVTEQREGMKQLEMRLAANAESMSRFGDQAGKALQHEVSNLREESERLDREFKTFGSAFRSEILEHSSAGVRDLREAVTKLRDDCREAMQREIRTRMERDTELQAAIESESQERAEAIDSIHSLVDELHEGLQSHTHELHVESASQSMTALAATQKIHSSQPDELMQDAGGAGSRSADALWS